MPFEGMAEVSARGDRVDVLPPALFTDEIPGLDQVGEDPLDCPLGDSDRLGDLPGRDVRLLVNAQQDMRVVAEKRPDGAATRRIRSACVR